MAQEELFNFRSIGVIESAAKYRTDAPRQSVFASQGAFLRWHKSIYADCAVDLKGFDRIWLIWVFDRNENNNFHPMVRVPVPAAKDKYSVFATRSPYRPNPVGISAVELIGITENGLILGNCDLLDGTNVLDVKPYIPEADAFPDSSAGWRDEVEKEPFSILWSEEAAAEADFILHNGGPDMRNICNVQLSYRPTDNTRKRVKTGDEENKFILHYRTWKIYFYLDEISHKLSIEKIAGNYSDTDLAPGAEDRYDDKELHRAYIKIFSR